jgi:transposase
MIMLPSAVIIYLCDAPIDMRCSFDGLSAIVRNNLGLDPMTGHLFLFLSKRGDRAKILFWDKDGYALFYKRLEKGRFHRPILRSADGHSALTLTSSEMTLLLSGIDLTHAHRHKRFIRPTATLPHAHEI